jgi:hypothetical protein
METVMRRRIILAALVLGLVAVTLALAQQVIEPPKAQPSRAAFAPNPNPESSKAGKAELHSRVAGLRAAVELLQIEHDAIKASLCDRLKGAGKANVEVTLESEAFKVAEDYMRVGAEMVGKAAEFDKAIQEDRAAIEKALAKVREIPTEINHWKDEFLRLSTELNQKKIELVELETRLEGSM